MHGSKKDNGEEVVNGILYKIFKVAYVPLLLKKWVRAFVMLVFFGWLCSSIAVVPHIEIGLDQELSMPEDSFVLKYFKVCIDISNGKQTVSREADYNHFVSNSVFK